MNPTLIQEIKSNTDECVRLIQSNRLPMSASPMEEEYNQFLITYMHHLRKYDEIWKTGFKAVWDNPSAKNCLD